MLGILENIEENQRKSTKVGMTRGKKRQNNFKRFVIRRSCELKSATNIEEPRNGDSLKP